MWQSRKPNRAHFQIALADEQQQKRKIAQQMRTQRTTTEKWVRCFCSAVRACFMCYLLCFVSNADNLLNCENDFWTLVMGRRARPSHAIEHLRGIKLYILTHVHWITKSRTKHRHPRKLLKTPPNCGRFVRFCVISRALSVSYIQINKCARQLLS